MFERLIEKFTSFYDTVADAARQRRERKAAAAAATERLERRVLVQALAKKLEAAHVECEQKKKAAAAVVLSVDEIQFVEWNLSAWTRHLKVSEIYEVKPQGEAKPGRGGRGR